MENGHKWYWKTHTKRSWKVVENYSVFCTHPVYHIFIVQSVDADSAKVIAVRVLLLIIPS